MSTAPARQKQTRKWIVRRTDAARAKELSAALGISPIVANLRLARGHERVDSATAFLNPSLDQLNDPSLMLGMSEAVERLLYAMDHQQPILIYGDYDVDGPTGTAVLLRAL